jgi:hypothetical protein
MYDQLPDDETIQKIKARYPGRSLHFAELTENGEKHVFILTGPSKVEYKKFQDDFKAAGNDSTKLTLAVESSALAQIRWPEREDVQALFENKPGLVQHFAPLLVEFAGSNAEVRSGKL